MYEMNLDGPYKLNSDTINSIITKEKSGVYTLGHIKNQTFVVDYVGRSDKNLNSRLKEHIEDSRQYTHFKAKYAWSTKMAFDMECIMYHDYGGKKHLDNENHPDRKNHKNWRCPICDIFN